MPHLLKQFMQERMKRARKQLGGIAKKRRVTPRRFYRGVYNRRVMPSLALGMKGEIKSIDLTQAAVDVDTGGDAFILNACSQGSTIATRIGRKILMKSIQIKGRCYSTATTGERDIQRLIIVYDKQTNGVATTLADVIDAVNVYALRNMAHTGRFTVIADERIEVGPAIAQYTGGYSMRPFQFYKKLNLPVVFNSGNAGTVADIESGSLFFMMVGTRAAGATAGVLDFMSRVKFTDV